MLTALSPGTTARSARSTPGAPAEALRRLETLALMADVGLPHAAIREQVADAIDLVVCAGPRRRRQPPRDLAVAEVVRVAGGAAAREIYTLRGGPPDLARAARRRSRRAAAARLSAAAPPRPLARRDARDRAPRRSCPRVPAGCR